jgi:hypothetical protein
MNIYPWVDMVLFSELCAYGPSTHAQPWCPAISSRRCAHWHAKHGVWLLPGSIFERRRTAKIYNTASVIDPEGSVVTRYRKMFPFYPYEVGVTPAARILRVRRARRGRFGVSICYDMWFPETTRTLAVMGAEVILHPTLTGTIDREIELSIARAAPPSTSAISSTSTASMPAEADAASCAARKAACVPGRTTRSIIPIEINMEKVRRSRELGVLRLGQPLKSFRDRPVDFGDLRAGREASAPGEPRPAHQAHAVCRSSPSSR